MSVRGPITHRRLSVDAIAALESGDIPALLAAERREFGVSVMMADSDDDDDDKDTGDDDDDDKPSGHGDDDDDGKNRTNDDDSDAEMEKLRKRMKAADKRADEAAAALKKREDADKGELERATETVTELEAKLEELTETVKDLRLQNAFLTANTHSWHDPDVALKIAESKKYLEDVVDGDGEVDKKVLGKALDRLAKEHVYLVKTEVKKDNPDDDNPSGEPAGGRSDNLKDEKAKKQGLQKRFSVLNR